MESEIEGGISTLTTRHPMAAAIRLSRESGCTVAINGETGAAGDEIPFVILVATGGVDVKRLQDAYEALSVEATDRLTVNYE